MKKQNPIRQDLEKLKTMSGKERVEFIWIYYRWYLLAAVLSVFVVCHFAFLLWYGQRPCRLRVNVVLNDQNISCASWFRSFEKELKADGLPGDLDMNEDNPFDYDNRYFQVMEIRVMTTISSGRMDVAICNEDLYSYLLALKACAPLDQLIPEYREQLVKSIAGQTINPDGSVDSTCAQEGFYALNLTNTSFGREYNAEQNKPLYAVMIANTEHPADSLILLRALMKDES